MWPEESYVHSLAITCFHGGHAVSFHHTQVCETPAFPLWWYHVDNVFTFFPPYLSPVWFPLLVSGWGQSISVSVCFSVPQGNGGEKISYVEAGYSLLESLAMLSAECPSWEFYLIPRVRCAQPSASLPSEWVTLGLSLASDRVSLRAHFHIFLQLVMYGKKMKNVRRCTSFVSLQM